MTRTGWRKECARPGFQNNLAGDNRHSEKEASLPSTLLQTAAGTLFRCPSWVKRYSFGAHRKPLNVRFALRATELLRRREMSDGHVWTAPAVQEESDVSAKRSGAAMYPACFRLEDCPVAMQPQWPLALM